MAKGKVRHLRQLILITVMIVVLRVLTIIFVEVCSSRINALFGVVTQDERQGLHVQAIC